MVAHLESGNNVDLAECGLQVYRIKANSNVYYGPDASEDPIHTLEQEREFEVIRVRGDFVCVVVPALGLGWVEMAQVVKLEPISPVVTRRGPYELVLQFTTIDEEAPQLFRSFCESVGLMLCAVDLSHNKLAGEFEALQSIITHCTHLKHLVLCRFEMATGERELLLDALRGGNLGRRLISLNLNCNQLDLAKITEIVELLSDTERMLALEELCLDVDSLDGPGRVCLANALRVNNTLTVLELQEPDSNRRHYERGDQSFISRKKSRTNLEGRGCP